MGHSVGPLGGPRGGARGGGHDQGHLRGVNLRAHHGADRRDESPMNECNCGAPRKIFSRTFPRAHFGAYTDRRCAKAAVLEVTTLQVRISDHTQIV